MDQPDSTTPAAGQRHFRRTVLRAVLRAEQITTRYQVPTGIWPWVAKWALLSATYLMNTWTSWTAGFWLGVMLHSVPSLVVVIAALLRRRKAEEIFVVLGSIRWRGRGR